MTKILSRGSKAMAYTERGTEVQVQYAIVELDSLVASHTIELKKNPKFPAKLQPRDRNRIASDSQINNIAKNLKPPLLGAYSSASNGAPIVGPDLVVESGNARVIALQRYHRRAVRPAQTKNPYRLYLLEQAKSLKLSKTAIENAEHPALVRLRLSRVNREAFVRECNESTVATLSAAEQGAVDAKHLTPDLLSLFSTEDTEIASVANRDFVKGFMAQVVAPAERNKYIDANGQLSQDGVRRIQYALCSKAYNDAAILARLAESVDDKIKRISQTLISKAALLAALKLAIQKKRCHPLDVTPDLAAAVKVMASLRENNKSIKAYLAQKNLHGEELSDNAKAFLEEFERRKGKGLDKILDYIVKETYNLGHPGQRQLGERKLPTLNELVKDAIKHRSKGEKDPKQKSRGSQAGSPELIEVRFIMQKATDAEAAGKKKEAIKLYKDVADNWKSKTPRKAWRARQALERLGVPGYKA